MERPYLKGPKCEGLKIIASNNCVNKIVIYIWMMIIFGTIQVALVLSQSRFAYLRFNQSVHVNMQIAIHDTCDRFINN